MTLYMGTTKEQWTRDFIKSLMLNYYLDHLCDEYGFYEGNEEQFIEMVHKKVDGDFHEIDDTAHDIYHTFLETRRHRGF